MKFRQMSIPKINFPTHNKTLQYYSFLVLGIYHRLHTSHHTHNRHYSYMVFQKRFFFPLLFEWRRGHLNDLIGSLHGFIIYDPRYKSGTYKRLGYLAQGNMCFINCSRESYTSNMFTFYKSVF